MKNKEIAEKLGVSPATFSLAINNKPGVSEKTRNQIVSQLKELGYSHLIKDSNILLEDNISFVVYKRDGAILDRTPFFLLLMEALSSSSRVFGYNIIFTTIDRRKPLAQQIDNLNSTNVKGAIIFATEMFDDDIEAFSTLKIPHVILDNDFTTKEIDSVAINNALGTFQIVEHLVNSGHKKIGYLSSKSIINSFIERKSGFISALKHFNIDFDEKYHFSINFCEEGSYRDFKKILDTNPELPTAFFTDDDTIAAGVIMALNEKGYKIPEDISIIGFDDRPLCERVSPPLSSVRVPRYLFGSYAVELLVKKIRACTDLSSEYTSIKLRVGTKLIIRNSVANINSK